jgi:hypothetical protein
MSQRFEHSIAGFSALGAIGKKAESVGEEAQQISSNTTKLVQRLTAIWHPDCAVSLLAAGNPLTASAISATLPQIYGP